jgi:hypothetical protein
MNETGHFGHVKSISTYTYARTRARVYVLIVSSCPKCPGVDLAAGVGVDHFSPTSSR